MIFNIFFAALCVCLAMSTQALAQTNGTGTDTVWTVYVGGTSSYSDGLGTPPWHFNKFYPNSLTITEGDSVVFTWGETGTMLHTVTFTNNTIQPYFTATGENPLQLVTGDVATVTPGSTVSSGSRTAFQTDYTVEFPVAGYYSYYCLFHAPAQVGSITVLPASSSSPSSVGSAAGVNTPRLVQAAALAAISADDANAQAFATARNLDNRQAPYTTSGQNNNYLVYAGWSFITGGGVATLSRFVPAGITINAGDTVTWSAENAGTEPHNAFFMGAGWNVVFPPGDVTIQAGPNLITIPNPLASTPGNGSAYDGSKPISTGFLSTFPLTGPAVTKGSITFTTPGIYKYQCSLHDDMGMWGWVEVLPSATYKPSYNASIAFPPTEPIVSVAATPAVPTVPTITGNVWTVFVGGSSSYSDNLGSQPWSINKYYPAQLNIAVGDSVVFKFTKTGTMPHTVTFTNNTIFPYFTATGESSFQFPYPVGGTRDFATLSPASVYLSSGSRNANGLHGFDYTVTFPIAGSYQYYCIYHAPEQVGWINVLPSSSTTALGDGISTTPLGVIANANAQLQRDDATAQAFATTQNLYSYTGNPVPTPNDPTHTTYTVIAGYAFSTNISNGYVTSSRFYPSGLTVNIGDTVIFTTKFAGAEPHLATFYGQGWTPQFPSGDIQLPNGWWIPNPAITTAGNGSAYSGVGPLSSGFLASFPLQGPNTPVQWPITFTSTGIYRYQCTLHDDMGMWGTIEVLPDVTPAVSTAGSYFGYISTASGSSDHTGTGWTTVTLNPSAGTLAFSAQYSQLEGNITVAHIHCCTASPFKGTVGPAIIIPVQLGSLADGTSLVSFSSTLTLSSAEFIPAFVSANGGSEAAAFAAVFAGIAAGTAYFNVHTTSNPGGDVSAYYSQGAFSAPSAGVYATPLSAWASSNDKTGSGSATVSSEPSSLSLSVSISFSGVSSPVTASHIHCCTSAPGVGTVGPALILGVALGYDTGAYSYSASFNATSAVLYPGFLAQFGGSTTNALAALLSGITTGNAYVNVHTQANPGGDISGYLALSSPLCPLSFPYLCTASSSSFSNTVCFSTPNAAIACSGSVNSWCSLPGAPAQIQNFVSQGFGATCIQAAAANCPRSFPFLCEGQFANSLCFNQESSARACSGPSNSWCAQPYAPTLLQNFITQGYGISCTSPAATACPVKFPYLCTGQWGSTVCFASASAATQCNGPIGSWCALPGAPSTISGFVSQGYGGSC